MAYNKNGYMISTYQRDGEELYEIKFRDWAEDPLRAIIHEDGSREVFKKRKRAEEVARRVVKEYL